MKVGTNLEQVIKLSKRLQAIADYVSPGSFVADIGTDHAYLPVYLAQKGISQHIYACDIAKEPLESAKETILKYGLSDKITPILSDGLLSLTPISADTIIMAGIGGKTIINILEDAPWIKSEDLHLILQPMTDVHEVRRYLYSNGFCIKSEHPVWESEKIYSVMDVQYTSITENITDVFSYIGKIPFHDSYEREIYIKSVLTSLRKKKDGILKSNNKDKKTIVRQLERTINSIEQIMKGIKYHVNSERYTK